MTEIDRTAEQILDDEEPEVEQNARRDTSSIASILGLHEPKSKLDALLGVTVRRKATDLHINAGNPPYLRIDHEMIPLADFPVLDENEVRSMIFSCMTGQQNSHFIEEMDVDFSYDVRGLGRFRVNALFERNYLGAVYRHIPSNPLNLEQLGVPDLLKKLCWKKQGLVLVTGRTGNGKTSTLAGALQYINEMRRVHAITIEDPIEYFFENNRAFIRQREVGTHVRDFKAGLRNALRQDPDVIIVGEMRDLETISIALSAAETGHLVFSTLHTFGAVESINRIIDPFPPEQQQQIRLQLSACLEAVFAQCLVPKAKEQGVALAVEIMIATSAVRNLIREGRIHQIRQIIETHAEDGMVSMEKALTGLFEKGLISYDDAVSHAVDQVSIRDILRMKGLVE